jgi:hemerythrin-like metal-binding protein
MKNFEWDESVALGIPHIDEQHKALFGWINGLNDSMLSGCGHEKVEELILNLINYVKEHFSEEERLMLVYSYPQLVSHRSEHDQFVDKLLDIQTSFLAGNDMSATVHDFMVNWLVCHIKGTDQGYSRFIHDRESKD